MIELNDEKEVAIAMMVLPKGREREKYLSYLDELVFLCETTGLKIAEKTWQEMERPKVATLIGKGKIDELKELMEHHGAKTAVFDNDLSPVQVRNLEEKLNAKILDRSGIILDIFAKRAKSDEAKTQVELAQLQYLMPRLTRMWTHLSKQYGGVGTKGPGETQIEVDRRLIRDKISFLKDKLEDIDQRQAQTRKKRKDYIRFALVGYTNVGKSTIMKLLTEEDVYIKDELFATLDTTVRAISLPNKETAILSDTVGFIRLLPAHLIASFRSTLAEALEADFVLHVVDISSEQYEEQIEIVNKTLKDLGLDLERMSYIFNKSDMIEDQEIISIVREKYPDSVFISAKKGINVSGLNSRLQKLHDSRSRNIKLMVPYSEPDISHIIYQYSNDVGVDSDEIGNTYTFGILAADFEKIKGKVEKYIID
ncbi:MAG: GTPase HflX [Candidatus Kapaibacteriales bacterium]